MASRRAASRRNRRRWRSGPPARRPESVVRHRAGDEERELGGELVGRQLHPARARGHAQLLAVEELRRLEDDFQRGLDPEPEVSVVGGDAIDRTEPVLLAGRQRPAEGTRRERAEEGGEAGVVSLRGGIASTDEEVRSIGHGSGGQRFRGELVGIDLIGLDDQLGRSIVVTAHQRVGEEAAGRRRRVADGITDDVVVLAVAEAAEAARRLGEQAAVASALALRNRPATKSGGRTQPSASNASAAQPPLPTRPELT